MIVLALLALVAVVGPTLTEDVLRASSAEQDLTHQFGAPSLEQGRVLLGTDELGRSTLVRLIVGARYSLGVALLAVTVAVLMGTTVGLTAGYRGSFVDSLLMRTVDVILAIPPLFLFILLSVLFRPSAVVLALFIAAVGWGATARIVRSEVLSLRSREFVLAARSVGATDRWILGTHILPNVLSLVIVVASLGFSQVLLLQAGLDFLGLGVQPPTPSWGSMLTKSQLYFVHSVWLVVLPGLAIFVSVLAASLLGNGLRDALDPRLR